MQEDCQVWNEDGKKPKKLNSGFECYEATAHQEEMCIKILFLCYLNKEKTQIKRFLNCSEIL